MDANSRNCSSNHQHDRTHRTTETPTPATGQAPLHDPGGRETPPARGPEGSTPFVVRQRDEATRSYQICPKCGGQKHVNKPPYIGGDQHTWVAGNTEGYKCPVCDGRGVIESPLRPLELHP
jgi:rRNA maturation protein Nop10